MIPGEFPNPIEVVLLFGCCRNRFTVNGALICAVPIIQVLDPILGLDREVLPMGIGTLFTR